MAIVSWLRRSTASRSAVARGELPGVEGDGSALAASRRLMEDPAVSHRAADDAVMACPRPAIIWERPDRPAAAGRTRRIAAAALVAAATTGGAALVLFETMDGDEPVAASIEIAAVPARMSATPVMAAAAQSDEDATAAMASALRKAVLPSGAAAKSPPTSENVEAADRPQAPAADRGPRVPVAVTADTAASEQTDEVEQFSDPMTTAGIPALPSNLESRFLPELPQGASQAAAAGVIDDLLVTGSILAPAGNVSEGARLAVAGPLIGALAEPAEADVPDVMPAPEVPLSQTIMAAVTAPLATNLAGRMMEAVSDPAANEEPADAASLETPAEPAADATMARVNSHVNMRAEPENGATVVSVLDRGSAVEVLSCDHWCDVNANGTRGWIYKSFIDGAG